jgi:diguanylate cyclase (GGDEF)-like protein
MLKARRDLDLSEKTLGTNDCGELVTEDLERDLAAVAQVVGEIDHRHSAGADLALDGIAIRELCVEEADVVHSRGPAGVGARSYGVATVAANAGRSIDTGDLINPVPACSVFERGGRYSSAITLLFLPSQAAHYMKDELTELLNPEAFRLLVEHQLAVARRFVRADALLVIDVSGLQAVNDEFGRAGGDVTLRAIARLLRRTARESDIVGRLGEDQFAVFALDCVGNALSTRISDAVSRTPDRLTELTIRQLSVELKVAITEVRHSESFEELSRRAAPSTLYAGFTEGFSH